MKFVDMTPRRKCSIMTSRIEIGEFWVNRVCIRSFASSSPIVTCHRFRTGAPAETGQHTSAEKIDGSITST